ncbi:BREX-1 system adenine-specific DNA-methyltransferase PglX [Rubripirellula sp.]|nr:BREX-1 system adenine-specific DNA-methyltransferase PglX [Rubripirellula sp.]
METKHLKKYAPEARREFIEAATNKAAVYGLLPDKIVPMQEEGDVVIIGDRPFPRTVAKQRKELEDRIRKEGFQQFIEAVAYTWFNRLVAIRYMELHGYLDHGYRVLSHPEGKTTPEILENAERIELPGLNQDEVVDLKLDGGKDEQLYQMLLLAQCNALHKAMPFLFESIRDGTELLLPDNLLHTDSLVRTLVNDIPEEQWENVEIIGWLYQFYISEKKDEVIGKVVKSEDIPAATQLFTPNWIVKYLVQNSLGRQWMATYPDSPLKQQMEFYIEPAEQTSEVQQQLDEITPESLNPEELTLLDPACGSGHILVEAYDLFKAIYTERGYRARDIPKLILTNNLHGLEIDDRAAQLAAFSLMMKARADDRRLFEQAVHPNVLAIQESKGMDANEVFFALTSPLNRELEGELQSPAPDGHLFETDDNLFTRAEATKAAAERPLTSVDFSEATIASMLELFENAKTFGSLIQIPTELADKLPAIETRLSDVRKLGDLTHTSANVIQPLIEQAKLLSQQYDAVVANPPYMGSSFYTALLKTFVNKAYAIAKSDLYACFVLRNLAFAKRHGTVGMITIPNWMFISRFEDFRSALLDHQSISSFVHNGRGVWGSDFGSCSFVLRNSPLQSYSGVYKRLFGRPGSVSSSEELRDRFFSSEIHIAASSDFEKVPGSPIVYWASEAIREVFGRTKKVGNIVETREGLATADNDRFLRLWHEVDFSKIHLNCPGNEAAVELGKKWFWYVKGGPYRKWYGNNDHIVNWQNDGAEVKANIDPDTGRIRSHNYNGDFAFREGCTWSGVSISALSVRHVPIGFMFDAKGPMAFAENHETLFYVIALLNSEFGRHMMSILAPTVDFKLGHIMNVPARPDDPIASAVATNCGKCIGVAKDDWDESETSFDFENGPFVLSEQDRIEGSFEAWKVKCADRIKTMAALEQKNNELLIESFGLQGELSLLVDHKDISLSQAEVTDCVTRIVSHALGCMMGRYSLDVPGLIYAHSGNEGFDPSKYTTFLADDDGIVPITDIAWFPDDAANRFEEFIKAAWPKEHLEENLTFVADSLSKKKNETSRECIRRYFSTGFYKHHLSMYKKRPIYWLFSSGKQRAFQCLVYLHRYNAGTLSRMRTEYVVPLQGKMNARIEQLESDFPAASSTSHRKKLEKERDTLVKQREELQEFDEKLRHYADQRIELDLDDGVKVNYGKFGDLLSDVKSITGKKPIVEVSA